MQGGSSCMVASRLANPQSNMFSLETGILCSCVEDPKAMLKQALHNIVRNLYWPHASIICGEG
jgi:hypothetical protein